MSITKNCPCQSEKSYQDCCSPFIDGGQYPDRIEHLMRSRYTAYHDHNMNYIVHTMSGKALEVFQSTHSDDRSQHIRWTGLDIKHVDQQQEKGTVEFVASYILEQHSFTLHEKSLFIKQQGRWFYVDGLMLS